MRGIVTGSADGSVRGANARAGDVAPQGATAPDAPVSPASPGTPDGPGVEEAFVAGPPATPGADRVTATAGRSPEARLHDALQAFADAVLGRARPAGAFEQVPSVREALEALEQARTDLGDRGLAVLRAELSERSELHHDLQRILNPRVEIYWKDLVPVFAQLGVKGRTELPFDPIAEAYGAVASRHRYALGDLVAVPISQTEVAEGIAVKPLNGQGLEVEYRDRSGATCRRLVPWKELLAANPMKIGDRISDVPGMGTVVCEGVDAKGQLRGRVESADGASQLLGAAGLRRVSEQLAPRFVAQMDPAAPFPADLIARAKEAAPVPGGDFVPPGGSVHHAFVGGAITPGVMEIETELVSIAFQTHAGWGYKPWNEDGVVAGVFHAPDPKRPDGPPNEYAYVLVLDWAGGAAQVEGEVAAGTKDAADALPASLDLIRREGKTPREALIDFVWRANAAVTARKERSEREGTLKGGGPGDAAAVNGTTLNVVVVGAIVTNGREVDYVSEGDGQLLTLGRTGVGLRTKRDNRGDELAAEHRDVNAGLAYANGLKRSLGDIRPFDKPQVDGDFLEEGESVLLFSDGLGDANEHAQLAAFRARAELPESLHWNASTHLDHTVNQIAQLYAGADPTPVAAVEALNAFARRSDESGRGKPDNKTYAVIRPKRAPGDD